MKKLFVFALIVAGMTAATSSFAQDKKAPEKKEMKAEKKGEKKAEKKGEKKAEKKEEKKK